MYNNKKIVAIIPARAGSKGIKDKNIKKLLGKPLVRYTIDAALKSKFIDKIIISSDSKKVLKLANEIGLLENNLRPERLSNDTAILADVVKYELIRNNISKSSFVVLLQPTSPLRTTEIIDDSIIEFFNSNASSAVSVTKININPFLYRIIKSGKLEKIIEKNSTIRRQDLPEYFEVNGMIYINKASDIYNDKVSFNDNEFPIIIPESIAIDIDSLTDFKNCEKIMKRQFNIMDNQ